MTTRARRRSTKSHRWLMLVAGVVIAGIVLVLLAPSLIVNWVRSYVQQEAFTAKMEDFLGTKLNGNTRLAPLRWSGDEVTCAEARITTATGWEAEMDGLHVALDWNAFRTGVWRLTGAGADSLQLKYNPTAATPANAPTAAEEVETLREPSASGEDAPAWLRRWLPTRTEIEGASVDRFNLSYPASWAVREARLRMAPWRGESSTVLTMEGGHLETPLRLPAQLHPLKFNLTRASARLSREQLLLNEATLRWIDPAEITVRGSVRPKERDWKVSAQLTGVPLQECLAEDWRTRLTGRLEGDLSASGNAQAPPVIEGNLQLRDGVLTALPILDRLATYTGVERFKRLVLDLASSHVRHEEAAGTRFEKIVLQSNGLLRIEGTLTVRQRQIEGDFLLGVTQDTLRWFPGAQQHVFTLTNANGPPGLLWTTLKISGTLDAPREDLSDRILAGAGKAIIGAPGEVVSKGTELLLSPVLGKDAAAQPGAVIKGAGDTLNKGVETGVKLLEGLGGSLLGK
ncbi:MAG TPA: hypothetical protein VD994_04175 [Prosthecobacter sp.]|nr:hypothetical protein [Prosthecobacter sp.]